MLKTGGIMSICIYSGGDSGFEERDGVLEYLSQLDDRKYFIAGQDFPNKKNNANAGIYHKIIIKKQWIPYTCIKLNLKVSKKEGYRI